MVVADAVTVAEHGVVVGTRDAAGTGDLAVGMALDAEAPVTVALAASAAARMTLTMSSPEDER